MTETELVAVRGRRIPERGCGMSWSSSHRGTEYRLIMTAVIGLCTAGAAGSVVPGLDTAVGAVLPAPIRRPARALTVVPISPSAPAVANPRTPTGGAA